MSKAKKSATPKSFTSPSSPKPTPQAIRVEPLVNLLENIHMETFQVLAASKYLAEKFMIAILVKR